EFIVTINPVNDAPIMDLPQTLTFDEDSSNTEDFSAFVSDVDLQDLILTAVDSDNVFVNINSFESTFTFTENWNGTETIEFTIDDQQGRSVVSDVVEISVEYVNDNPTYIENSLPDSITFNEDTINESINLNDVFTDLDLIYGDELSFTFADNNFISVEIENGDVTLIPDANWFGADTLSFIATDNFGQESQRELLVKIENVNDDPVIDFSSIEVDFENGEIIFEEGGTFIIDFSDYVTDIDQSYDEMSVEVSGYTDIIVEIDGMVVTLSTSQYWSGSEVLTFTIKDNQTRAEDFVTLKVIVNAQFEDERVELEYHTISWDNPISKFDITTKRNTDEIEGKIFNKSGRLIKELNVNANGDKKIASWDAKASNGTKVSGGFYIYQFKIGDKIYQGSIIVAR
ncbi:MAG: Ig-like domain-containing protein, partial [Candidatus Cloacimonadota bacterium]|nr:Ig-like domain-containing protein [Candidatus Cloacimonadota bacterium]